MRILSLLIPASLSILICAGFESGQSQSIQSKGRTYKHHLSPSLPVSSPSNQSLQTPLTIDINVLHAKGFCSKIWRGFDLTEDPSAKPQNWESLDPLLRKNGALLLRCDPFSSNPIKMASDGSALVNWTAADTVLSRFSTSGLGLAISIAPPEALSAAAWKLFVTQAVQRYGKDPKWNTARWELRSTASEARVLLPAFTSVIRTYAPASPVDFQLSAGNPLDGLTILAEICEKNKITCDCFSWRTPESSKQAFESIRQIHSAIAKLTALKSTAILPVLSSSSGEGSTASLLKAAVHLPEIAPMDGANPALGFLIRTGSALTAGGRPYGWSESRIGIFDKNRIRTHRGRPTL